MAPAGSPGVVEVIHEDDALLVVRKPAGLVCHPTKGDVYSSLISRLRLHREGQPVFLVNRLDRETSGVTLAAKSSEAAGELGRLFEARQVSKEYLAIVHGHPASDRFVVDAPLGKDLESEVAVKDRVRADGSPAVTRVEVRRRFRRGTGDFSLVRVLPESGRKHQIRIHLQHAGHPIVGDKLYGGDPGRYLRFVVGTGTVEDRDALLLEFQALHASRLALSWAGKDWEFTAGPEAEFLAFARGEGSDG